MKENSKPRNCRHCGVEMPIGSNRCPFCKKSQVYPIRLAIVLILLIFIFGIAVNSVVSFGGSPKHAPSPKVATKATQIKQKKTFEPTLSQTSPPTPTPSPTLPLAQSSAQAEQTFKASTEDTTVANLVKLGSGEMYTHVHFTCTIYNFLQDSSGITTSANVVDPNDPGSVIQIQFPAGTFINEVNKGDTIELWGVDDGSLPTQNAYGATIQEVSIYGRYMTDHTTAYIE